MARGQKLLKKPKRVTVLLEEEHFEFVKQKAIDMTVKENRIVTPTEIMRDALEQCYPLPGVTREECAYKFG
ncbi:hypothetical protein PNK_p0162 (plasmid) [Candidatus Protochlamydia naegleriophila]|uniref:CopG family transcriptional regulator n=1 Tax=Candidatus Protochlamydia naegleriophila TaxID=389348 RepID=A0A0U5JK82_9BACT|nr:hypothetical protein [Candidatus Protochlamydia naegleriophila]CUI18214.1 hypothetical protein PNK_p0162 [Candidatus Protochlamydia naegleriophila]